ncbi:MAG: DUF4296 domain-containing protein [Flavobacteriales bacterium]
MKLKVLFIVFIALSLFACHQSSTKREEPPLSEEAFASALVDVRILEGSYTVRYQRIDSTFGLMDTYYKQIFEKHNISQSDFEKSYTLYSLNVPVMERIEDTVIHRLERIDQSLKRDSTTNFNFAK